MGRPQADIDWKKVDDLLEAGCSGVEIASHFGLNPITLYDRCLTDHGIIFSKYSQEKHAKGDSILRAHQYAKALGLKDTGDNTLLIWLGKTRLKQRDESNNVNIGTPIIVKVTNDGLGSGLRVSAEALSDPDNKSPE